MTDKEPLPGLKAHEPARVNSALLTVKERFCLSLALFQLSSPSGLG